MKRNLLVSILVLVITLFGTIALLIVARTSERENMFNAAKNSFETVVRLELTGIRDGFFVWTDLRDLVDNRGAAAGRSAMDEIEGNYPFVLAADIERGSPPDSANYTVESDGRDLIVQFPIQDGEQTNALTQYHGVVKLDARKVLANLQSSGDLQIARTGGRPFTFNLKADFKNFVLSFQDFALAVFASILAFLPTYFWVRRRSSFFYESRGLESIIFLFEQSERFSSNHSRRVAALAAFIGMQMGMKGRRLRDLYIAALLHDIGKLSIPLEILIKNGALTPQEYAIVQGHPLSSAKILNNFRELSHLGVFALYHHERMDGSGYPEGIWGTAIPLESRIIAVADVFDALVGERPYRSPMPIDDAFEHLRSIALDQEIVEILALSYKEFGEYKLPKWVLKCQYSPFEMRPRDVYELKKA